MFINSLQPKVIFFYRFNTKNKMVIKFLYQENSLNWVNFVLFLSLLQVC